MIKKTITILSSFIVSLSAISQAPKYTKKEFVTFKDTSLFKPSGDFNNGSCVSYLNSSVEVWDVDDNNTTHINFGVTNALLKIKGPYKNGKRNGIFTFSIINKKNKTIIYKLWEQDLKDDHLNGSWKIYNLKGVLVQLKEYKEDSAIGTHTDFWIDGVTKMNEKVYLSGSTHFIFRAFENGRVDSEFTIKNKKRNGLARQYYPSGKISAETTFENDIQNGIEKTFYESGSLQEELTYVNGKINGERKYYYPNGKIWLIMEYKNGLSWNVIANFDKKGKKRNPGSLSNGNGTFISYDEKGNITEIVNYLNGYEQK